jgi:hypothetical protein
LKNNKLNNRKKIMTYQSLKLASFLLLFGLISKEVYSQTDNVGIGTTTPNNSAVLDLTSITKGFLAPRMTQAQRTAIVTPAIGLFVYQTDNPAGFYYYNGATWIYGLNGTGASAFAWGLTGNAGTNPTNNFVGTTDNQPLYFKSNSVTWYIINTNGSLQRDNAGNARGVQAVDLQSNRSAVTQVATGDYSFLANGSNNTATGTNSFVGGGNNNEATGANSAIFGGQYLKLGTSSFGFNASSASLVDLSAFSNIGYIGNTNLMIGNSDNTARELRFLEPTATPGTSFYSSFKAQTQSANITYVLPATQGTANTLLKNDGSGNLSWSASSGWNLTGNATTDSTTNFLGTTDDIPFVLKTNNTERVRVRTNGQIGISSSLGLGTNDPATNLHIYENNTDTEPAIQIQQASTGDAALRLITNTNSQNISVGIDASDNSTFKVSNASSLGADANTMMKIHTRSGSEGIVEFTNQSRSRAYLGAAQTIATATWTQVSFDNESFDAKNEFSITNYQFTCKEAGYYQVNSRVEFNTTGMTLGGAADIHCSIAIYVDGTVYSMGNKLAFKVNNSIEQIYGNDAPIVSDIVYLTAGQIISIRVYQNIGGNLPLRPNSGVSYVSIHKLS